MTTRLGASALVVDDRGRILLTQRQDLRNWVFPGGGVRENESIQKAVAREVYEETGIRIKLNHLAVVIIRDHWLMKSIGFLFLAKRKGGREKCQQGEVLAMKWVTKNKLKDYLDARHYQRFQAAFGKNDSLEMIVEKTLPLPWHKIPLFWWRRGLGKRLGLVKT